MRYVSTRGQAPVLNFEQAMLSGLARDGGLYLPETIPTFEGFSELGRCGGCCLAPFLPGFPRFCTPAARGDWTFFEP